MIHRLLAFALATPAFAGTLYVDAGLATGANDGSSWADAFQGSGGLQLALAAAGPGDQVWVADGTYIPTSVGTRTLSFQLESGVEIYGGFAGGEATLPERDPAANVAILSGDLLGDDVGFTNNAENSFHVVRGTGANATAILDGFTISGGNANGSSATSDDRGGGFLVLSGGQPTIVNCLVQGNRCTFGGGAGYINASSPTFTLCRFVNNIGGSFGGAFDMASGVGATFRRCTFTGNSANRAGGIEIFGSSPVKVFDCLFTGNTATGADGGGAIFISSSAAQVRGCTVTGNFSNVNATAGIRVVGAGATIANTIAYFNSGPGGAQGAVNQVSGGTTTYSCVQGGLGGTGNVSGDPLFTNAAGGDYTLLVGTPCADAGNNAVVPALSTTDHAGQPRISDDPAAPDTGSGARPIVDMGAFERQNELYETFCFGDGTLATPCPCGNDSPIAGHGCLNSDFFSTGGVAWATGASNPDTVAIVGAELRIGIACIVLQGNAAIAGGTPYGDGVRCVGGTSKRLYTKSADANGTVVAPGLGDPSITARSASMGDPIAPGSLRYYQVWYRDAQPAFCPAPLGDAWNVSAGVIVSW